MATEKGACYWLTSILLILSSIATMVLTSINLSNLMGSNTYIKLLSFNYTGVIEEFGPKSAFCREESYLKYAWLSGFLTVSALLLGFMAWWVKNVMSKLTILFLVFSSMTAFLFTLISCASNASVLYCHVVLTGKLPSGILFIAILSLLQSILSSILFFTICCKRIQIATDLKYGIDPIPDPWSLDLVEKDDALIVECKKPKKEVEKDETIPEKAPVDPMSTTLCDIYHLGPGQVNASYLSSTYFQGPQPTPQFPRITPVAAASNVPGIHPSFTLPMYNSSSSSINGKDTFNHTLTKQARVVLNAANKQVHHNNLSRHQLGVSSNPASTPSLVQPFSIDRLSGCPQEAFSPQSLPVQCVKHVY